MRPKEATKNHGLKNTIYEKRLKKILILKREGKGRVLLLSSTAQQKIVEKTELNFSSECIGKQDVLGTGCNKLNSHYKSGSESQEMVEQPAQRGCGIVSILGDLQNLPEHSPEESEINLPCFKQV